MATQPDTACRPRARYGHFDAQQREYVITEPLTPLPWINYLGSKALYSIVSNTGGGYSFYRDAKLRRLTRYRYDSVPLDSVGKYLYIADGECTWNPGFRPTRTPLDRYECRHGLGYTRFRSARDGLARGPARVRRGRGGRRVPGPHAAQRNRRRRRPCGCFRSSSGASGTRRTTAAICSAICRSPNAWSTAPSSATSPVTGSGAPTTPSTS